MQICFALTLSKNDTFSGLNLMPLFEPKTTFIKPQTNERCLCFDSFVNDINIIIISVKRLNWA